MINRTDPKQGDAWEGVPEVTDRVDLAPLLAGETGAGVGASRTMSNVRACVCVCVQIDNWICDLYWSSYLQQLSYFLCIAINVPFNAVLLPMKWNNENQTPFF